MCVSKVRESVYSIVVFRLLLSSEICPGNAVSYSLQPAREKSKCPLLLLEIRSIPWLCHVHNNATTLSQLHEWAPHASKHRLAGVAEVIIQSGFKSESAASPSLSCSPS